MFVLLTLIAFASNPCEARQDLARTADTAAVTGFGGSMATTVGEAIGNDGLQAAGESVTKTALQVETTTHVASASAAVECGDSPVAEIGRAVASGGRLASMETGNANIGLATGAVGTAMVISEAVTDQAEKPHKLKERPELEIDLLDGSDELPKTPEAPAPSGGVLLPVE